MSSPSEAVTAAPFTPPTIQLLWDPDADRGPAYYGRYLPEVLAHAGLAGGEPVTDLDTLTTGDVVIVARPAQDHEIERLTTFVQTGGALIILCPSANLAGLTGVRVGTDQGSARVAFVDHGLWTQLPPRPVRAVTGTTLAPDGAAEALASWPDGSMAVCRQRVGAGVVVTFGADVLASIVRIQQGDPVDADGVPASDETAPIDDGILKAEDGHTLDLDVDRALPPGQPSLPEDYSHGYPPPCAVPIFDQPQADWWRSLLLQAVWAVAEDVDRTAVWLGYWPAGVSAIAHMSHDADQNIAEDAEAALATFAEAEVTVTWCQVYPGGYGADIYAAIDKAGHEHALHYNAMEDSDIASWGWPQFRAQYAWAQAVTGRERIVSNKNHYTRWEGWTEFYHWCERVGIQIDESRGPSKQGTVGFPFGTAHLSFPLAEPGAGRHVHDVLNLPLHTQDLAWATHASVRDVILDGAQTQHGVAHFLFHGPHLRRRPATRSACLELAREARRRGMEWWTAEQINAWERARRTIRVTLTEQPGRPDQSAPSNRADRSWRLRVDAGQGLDRAAILIPVGRVPEDVQVSAAGADGASATDSVTTSVVQRHGRRFVELAIDVPAGTSSWLLRP